MKYLSLFCVVLVLIACETKWGDFGGYSMDSDNAMNDYIVLDKGEVIYGGDTPEEQAKKGTMVKYYRNSGKVDSGWGGNGSRVIGAFVDYDRVVFDVNFILVGQKPIDSICECSRDCLLERFQNLRGDLSTYDVCKDALEASTYYHYWIIDKRNDAIYGPFLKEAFLQKRKVLGVPKSLKYPLNLSR